MNLKRFILIGASFFLIFLYAFSFFSYREARHFPFFQTVFFNEKNKDNVMQINISTNESEIVLFNKKDFWCTEIDGNKYICDSVIIENILSSLKKVTKVYKIVDGIRDFRVYKDYELEKNRFSYITFDNAVTTINIGNQDFSKKFYYIVINFNKTPGEKNALCKTDFDFSKILSSNPSTFLEPYIVPRFVLQDECDIQKIKITKDNKSVFFIPKSNSDVEKIKKLISLRHGQIAHLQDFSKSLENPVLSLEIETMLDFFTIDFFSSNENYIMLLKIPLKNLQCAYNISSWTYNNIIKLIAL